MERATAESRLHFVEWCACVCVSIFFFQCTPVGMMLVVVRVMMTVTNDGNVGSHT